MPDRNAEILAAQRAAKQRQYDEGIARWHEQHPDDSTEHLTAEAIARCELCDREGYRRPELTVVCDHVDRSTSTAPGRALVQAELDKIRRRKADTARGGAA